MKVCVTGGTGFVGEEILRQLHADGHSCKVLVRNPDSPCAKKYKADFHAEICRGDVLEPESLEKFCSGGEAVIHLVGIISEIGENTFENIHTRGTQNVTDAARSAGIKRFVHMSALGTRPDAVARYHKSKWAAEEIVRQSGLSFTIFRPSIIYGRHDQFTNMFARMACFSPFVPVMGKGDGTFQPINVEAVAKCFVGALVKLRSIGQMYDLGGTEILTLNEVLDQILSVINRKRIKLHIPLPLARGLAAMLEFFFPNLLRKTPPLNRDQIIMLQEKTVGDIHSAKELFGIDPPHFLEGIAAYLRG